MNGTKLLAILLIVAGVAGLAYGGFTYTEDSHEANIGSLSLSIDDKRRVNIPVWAGVGLLVAGGLIFAIQTKRS